LLVVGATAVCVTAGIAAPVAGAREALVDVRMSGMVSAVWEATPARGCAAAGTCGISGSVTYRAGGFTLQLDSEGSGGGSSIATEPTVVRVRRETGTGPPETCVDVLSGFPFPPVTVFEDQLGFDFGGQELSAGRCAGPRPLDLARALPSRSVPFRSFTRTRIIDMSGRFPFVAGSFSGNVISTARATVRPVGRASSVRGDVGIERGRPVAPERPPRRRHAVLRLLYRATAVSGTVLTSFRGRVQPACLGLGACGARGTSGYEFAADGATVEVFALRPQRRGPARRRALLGALRRGALAVGAETHLTNPSARVRQAVTSAAGGTCGDAVLVEPPDLIARRLGTAPHMTVYLRPSDASSFADTLRARCPGPTQPDVLPGDVLARGRIALSRLGAPELPVTLGPTAGAFLGDGYSGERSGGVPLALRLVASDARIERF
jgi:hypothetical protein